MSLTHQLYLQTIREAEAYDDARFEAYRAEPLEALLSHIWREAPLQRGHLARLASSGRLDMARWQELPLLRSADIVRHGAALAAAKPRDRVEYLPPNGFAPIPIASRRARLAAECEQERFYELCDLDLGARLGILDPTATAGTRGRGWSITIEDSPWIAGDAAAAAADQAAFLNAGRIAILRTNRAIAEALADRSDRPELQALIVASDDLPEASRRRLRDAFGCRVVHLVLRPVLGACAISPDLGEPYAVPAASALVEVVDRAGRTVAPGDNGELTLTPLYETAYPLLRLATGIGATAPLSAGAVIGVRGLAAAFAL